jgi:pimeloyl-ACP methyl ester carboxylesterase
MGGFVSTEAVIDRPSRFDKLVLVSAAGISFAEAQGRQIEAAVSLFEASFPFLAGPRRAWLNRPRGRQFAFGRVFHYPNRIRPELLREQIEPGLQSPGFGDAIRAIGGYDSRHRLTEIEIPTLVVWGLNDHVVPVEAAIGYHRLVPDSQLELFERTGHVPQMERPERFNALLDEFLSE